MSEPSIEPCRSMRGRSMSLASVAHALVTTQRRPRRPSLIEPFLPPGWATEIREHNHGTKVARTTVGFFRVSTTRVPHWPQRSGIARTRVTAELMISHPRA